MGKFPDVFDVDNWIVFFANRKLRLANECENELARYFILWRHVTDLESGIVQYLRSETSSNIDEFLEAARSIGFNEIDTLIDEIKRIFYPDAYPAGLDQRNIRLAHCLRNWDGETEPFPELERHRQVFANLLQSCVESHMLTSPELFLRCATLYDPFEGNRALMKLKKRLQL